MTKRTDMAPGLVHLVTVGTTPPGMPTDVVDALIDDLRGVQPKKIVVLATEDSMENANRLLKAVRAKAPGRVRQIASAQSLDEAYHATSDEISLLIAEGHPASEIILHYTGGTKVMSAGAVLAAINLEVKSLRYLYSPGRAMKSEPVITSPHCVLMDNKLRLGITLMIELRFRAAYDLLMTIDEAQLSAGQREHVHVLRELANAYSEWDSFRVTHFLSAYRGIEERLKQLPLLSQFVISDEQLANLDKIRQAESSETSFPDELLVDLMNNAIRRLAERRPDDALIRLHRAAELYAQGILLTQYGIRTDDVEIRKVPPRYRTSFEAERRMDDATIKLGLRKSYDLLEILGSPVGKAYQEHATFRTILQERRNLILAHGTRPATITLALDFFREVLDFFRLRIPDILERGEENQFPWIDNTDVLQRLMKQPTGTESVIKEKKRKRRRGGRGRGGKKKEGSRAGE